MQSHRHAATGAGLLALMLALAAGCVWSVVIQWTENPAGWMAIPVALVIASAPAQLGLVAVTRFQRLLVNAVALVLATLYAQYLGAAAVVGRELGFDFLRTLGEIGPELAYALARERATPLDWWGLAAAFALLAAFGLLPKGRSGRL